MERFHIQKTLGDGAFGSVLQAENLKTGEKVAIKRMKKRFTSWEECINLREIRSLRKFNHQNIIKLKEVIKVKDELNLVFEFLDKDLLKFYSEYKQRNEKIPERDIKKISYQIFAALAHMHKHGFFHRDMKPENILMTGLAVKLADFGLAREIRSRPPYTEYVSTRWYRAPEILMKSENYNSPVDIFAVGCIIAELYMLSPLFNGASEIDQIYKVCQGLGTPTQSSWPEGFRLASKIKFSFPYFQPAPHDQLFKDTPKEAVSFILEQLKFDASKRPTANQILNHSYFADIEKEFNSQKEINHDLNSMGSSTQKSEIQKKLDEIKAAKMKQQEDELLSDDDSDSNSKKVMMEKPVVQKKKLSDELLDDDDDEIEKELSSKWKKPRILDRADPVQLIQNERTSYSFKNSITSKRDISSEKEKPRLREGINGQGLSGIQKVEKEVETPEKNSNTKLPEPKILSKPSFDKKRLFEARFNHFENIPFNYQSNFPLRNNEASLERRLSKEMRHKPFANVNANANTRFPPLQYGQSNFHANAQMMLPPIRNTGEKPNFNSLPPSLRTINRREELLEKYSKYKKY